MWMENLGFADVGEGWKMVDAGDTEMTAAPHGGAPDGRPGAPRRGSSLAVQSVVWRMSVL